MISFKLSIYYDAILDRLFQLVQARPPVASDPVILCRSSA